MDPVVRPVDLVQGEGREREISSLARGQNHADIRTTFVNKLVYIH